MGRNLQARLDLLGIVERQDAQLEEKDSERSSLFASTIRAYTAFAAGVRSRRDQSCLLCPTL